MALPNIFTQTVAEEIIGRIEKLTPENTATWGKMNIAQMLAHCNITYELVYEDKHPKPGFFMRFILKSLVKKKVINDIPYSHNSPTAPAFLITDSRIFEDEKIRLIEHIRRTQGLGENYFDNKVSHSFGPLTKEGWNNMFYKHLDHHLRQFGA